MERSHNSGTLRTQSISLSARVLLAFQVCTLMLILVNGTGDVGFGKAIIQSLPVLVSTGLITVSVRAVAHENEAGARNILSFGMLVVAMSALVVLRCI